MKRIHPFAVVVLASLVCAVGAQAQVTIAVSGIDPGPNGIGVLGRATATSGETIGVVGQAASGDGTGVVAESTAVSGVTKGLEARVHSAGGIAGTFDNTAGGRIIQASVGGIGVFFVDGNGEVTMAGNLGVGGSLAVAGRLTKSAGMFKIDHPLDPGNKYLSHSFVESPDMKNVYDGVVELDETGEARVPLPAWFQALNSDFRYQLTAIGAPMPQLYIATEISGNRFEIAGGTPSGKVSWQVTGIRKDAYAQAYRIPVEEEKTGLVKGTYLHPELYGPTDEERTELAQQQD